MSSTTDNTTKASESKGLGTLLLGLVFLILPAKAIARPAPKTVRITLVASGDVMFGRQRGRRLHSFGYKNPFRFVRPIISGHDIAMCNLETPITARRLFYMRRSHLLFRARPKAARLLKEGGFNLIVTANNHAHDQKDAGVVETLTHLKNASLAAVGTGRTLKEAFTPYIFTKQGVKIGVLAVTRLVNYGVKRRHGFVAHLTRRAVARVLPVKVRALKQRVDFVVVVIHWGVEYKNGVIGREKRLARSLERAGCDLLIGHHPHVLRGIERIGRMVAFYSLGNFMFDSAWGLRAESGLARVEITRKGKTTSITSARFLPVTIGTDHLPRPAKGRRAKRILRNMVRYSRRFRKTTRLKVINDHLEVILE